MRPLRVLQVSAYSFAQFGGVQTHVLDLSRALRQRGHEVRTVGPGPTSGHPEAYALGRAKRVGLAGTRFEVTSVDNAAMAGFSADMASWRPDIVHVHGIWVPFLPLQILRTVKAARVVTFHDTTAPTITGAVMRFAFRRISKRILDHVDASIAVSSAPLAHIRSGPSGMSPVIIPPVTDLAPFAKLTDTRSDRQHHVIYWGRLEPRKNIAVLLRAIELIYSKKTSHQYQTQLPRFTIAGSGPEEVMVQQAASRLGPDILNYVPSHDGPALLELISSSNMCVFPAQYGESFGIVLVEALASGRLVIAAANAGYSGVLTGPGQELLFPPADSQALADKILSYLGDEITFRKLVGWGRKHAEQYDVTARVKDFEGLYRAAMVQRSKREGSGNHD